MTFTEALTTLIPRRFSCRTYRKDSLSSEIRTRLVDLAAEANQGPFGNPTRFELIAATDDDSKALRGLGTYGFIKGATGFIVGTCQSGDRNLEDFGYQMEKLILHATDLGVGTCWLGGTFTKSRFAKKIRATTAEMIPAVTSIGYIASKPRRFDQSIRITAGSDHRLPWDRLFFDERFGAPLSRETAGELETALEMVRLAPSASNRQPWRIIKVDNCWHFYLLRTIGYRDSSSAKLLKIEDLQRVDMGIAMCHFELVAHELGIAGKWDRQQPDLYIPGERIEYSVTWVANAD
jgi:hypothetical protein